MSKQLCSVSVNGMMETGIEGASHSKGSIQRKCDMTPCTDYLREKQAKRQVKTDLVPSTFRQRIRQSLCDHPNRSSSSDTSTSLQGIETNMEARTNQNHMPETSKQATNNNEGQERTVRNLEDHYKPNQSWLRPLKTENTDTACVNKRNNDSGMPRVKLGKEIGDSKISADCTDVSKVKRRKMNMERNHLSPHNNPTVTKDIRMVPMKKDDAKCVDLSDNGLKAKPSTADAVMTKKCRTSQKLMMDPKIRSAVKNDLTVVKREDCLRRNLGSANSSNYNKTNLLMDETDGQLAREDMRYMSTDVERDLTFSKEGESFARNKLTSGHERVYRYSTVKNDQKSSAAVKNDLSIGKRRNCINSSQFERDQESVYLPCKNILALSERECMDSSLLIRGQSKDYLNGDLNMTNIDDTVTNKLFVRDGKSMDKRDACNNTKRLRKDADKMYSAVKDDQKTSSDMKNHLVIVKRNGCMTSNTSIRDKKKIKSPVKNDLTIVKREHCEMYRKHSEDKELVMIGLANKSDDISLSGPKSNVMEMSDRNCNMGSESDRNVINMLPFEQETVSTKGPLSQKGVQNEHRLQHSSSGSKEGFDTVNRNTVDEIRFVSRTKKRKSKVSSPGNDEIPAKQLKTASASAISSTNSESSSRSLGLQRKAHVNTGSHTFVKLNEMSKDEMFDKDTRRKIDKKVVNKKRISRDVINGREKSKLNKIRKCNRKEESGTMFPVLESNTKSNPMKGSPNAVPDTETLKLRAFEQIHRQIADFEDVSLEYPKDTNSEKDKLNMDTLEDLIPLDRLSSGQNRKAKEDFIKTQHSSVLERRYSSKAIWKRVVTKYD